MRIKAKILALATVMSLGFAGAANAQVAGFSTVSVNNDTLAAVAEGFSVQKSILRQPIYNDDDKKIGTIDDLIIDPEGTVSFAIISAGAFVGSPKHDVAIQVGHLMSENGKIVLYGATEEAIRALPEFKYIE